MQKTLDETFNLNKEYILILDDKIDIIKHFCKPFQ